MASEIKGEGTVIKKDFGKVRSESNGSERVEMRQSSEMENSTHRYICAVGTYTQLTNFWYSWSFILGSQEVSCEVFSATQTTR